MNRFAAHPIVFLESIVHLILGSVLLAKSPFESAAVGIVVALIFILVGFGFAVPAVGRYWLGAFSIVDDVVILRSGYLKRQRQTIQRSDVAEITTKRGARWLRVDPIHALLGRVVNYGSVIVLTRDQKKHIFHPVNPDVARATLEAWWERRNPPVAGQPSRALLPVAAALVFAAYAGGVISASGPGLSTTMPILLTCAAIFEVAFWVSLFSVNRHATRRS